MHVENNPDVMTRLGYRLGLSPSYAFYDVLSLTEPGLLEFLPRPCRAVLFTFPTSEASEKFFHEEEATLSPYDGSGPGESVLWYHQTIGNACGLIGLLHCTTNLEPDAILPGSILERVAKEGSLLKPADRAQMLYNSNELEAAHAEAAQQGDSIAPLVEEYLDTHAFIAFVKDDKGQLWELEGRRKGPVKRGILDRTEDLLSEKALSLGPRAYVEREKESTNADLRFSCTGLCPSIN